MLLLSPFYNRKTTHKKNISLSHCYELADMGLEPQQTGSRRHVFNYCTHCPNRNKEEQKNWWGIMLNLIIRCKNNIFLMLVKMLIEGKEVETEDNSCCLGQDTEQKHWLQYLYAERQIYHGGVGWSEEKNGDEAKCQRQQEELRPKAEKDFLDYSSTLGFPQPLGSQSLSLAGNCRLQASSFYFHTFYPLVTHYPPQINCKLFEVRNYTL